MNLENFNLDQATKFSVQVYGDLEKVTEVISKKRVRIFYRGLNRNGTYISDEFAQKLIDTLPYSPIKGIFDDETKDYTDHGIRRNEGRAYGIVPSPSNFAWEWHLDEDGIEREYACADVFLWTGIYEEAKLIPGKSQSMELYKKTLKGEWRIIEGQKCFYFTDGQFLGLQVLGDDTTPCFEGSAFYSLFTSMQELTAEVRKLKEDYSNIDFNKKISKEEKPMENMFKLSDNSKFNAIWSLLNNEHTAEGELIVSYMICDIFDDYALTYNLETGNYERIYYSKDDETDSVTILEKKISYILEITEEEKTALEALRALNDNTYEKIDEKFSALAEEQSTLTATNQQLSDTNVELQNSVNTLTETNAALVEDKEILQNELSSLQNYKKDVENNKKNEILAKYSAKLDDEIIKKYKENLDTYSVIDLQKELSFELIQNTPDIFSVENPIIPKPEINDGIGEILKQYKK